MRAYPTVMLIAAASGSEDGEQSIEEHRQIFREVADQLATPSISLSGAEAGEYLFVDATPLDKRSGIVEHLFHVFGHNVPPVFAAILDMTYKVRQYYTRISDKMCQGI